MNIFAQATIVGLLMISIAGCAATPAAPVAGAAAAAPPAAYAPVAAPIPAVAPAADDAAATVKAARALGYAPRQHDGRTVFCRTAPEIGTRVSSLSCISQEQVAAVVQHSLGNQESIEAAQRNSLAQPKGN